MPMSNADVKNGSRPEGMNAGQALAPLYANRSRTLLWRQQWFELSRSHDLEMATKLRDDAYAHKLRRIRERGRDSGYRAGFDPQGAGSPWYPLGPRNVNGRVKALAVHPTNPDIVFAGAASGGVWKSADGGQTWDPPWGHPAVHPVGALRGGGHAA